VLLPVLLEESESLLEALLFRELVNSLAYAGRHTAQAPAA
jgi:hypothetical protein